MEILKNIYILYESHCIHFLPDKAAPTAGIPSSYVPGSTTIMPTTSELVFVFQLHCNLIISTLSEITSTFAVPVVVVAVLLLGIHVLIVVMVVVVVQCGIRKRRQLEAAH